MQTKKNSDFGSSIEVEKKQESLYSPSDKHEAERLKLQATFLVESDIGYLNRIYETIGADGITVIDFGCADGTVGRSLFLEDERVKRVFGFDIDEKAIAKANEALSSINKECASKFRYYALSNKEDPSDEIAKALEAEMIEEVDLIYLSMVLHHLRRPIKMLRKLRGFLRDGGAVFAKSPDDGCTLSYPDKKRLVRQICLEYAKAPGTPDRFAGRKLYHQLKCAGLNSVRVSQELMDTTGMSYEDKLDVFEMEFSYMIDVYDQLLESDPGNSDYIKRRSWMENALEDLEDQFAEESFWYGAFDFVAVGIKPER